jgi:DNA repair exonuclease SbcCD ATPase subunit
MEKLNHPERKKSLVNVLIVLIVLAVLAIGYLGYKNIVKSKTETAMQVEMDKLFVVRETLESDMDSLNKVFERLNKENVSLVGSLDIAEEQMAKKNEQIRFIQRGAASDATTLQEEIDGLLLAKTTLEINLENLANENEELKQMNAELSEEVSELKDLTELVVDLRDANELLAGRVSDLARSSFRASSMQVDISKRNNKATIKSRRVRNMNISFDIAQVPEEYQGTQHLYFTISDAKGIPIESDVHPVKVGQRESTKEIHPLKVQKVDLETFQRLEFSHELENKLKPGYYIASVYANNGLLGSTIFKLV